MHRLLTLGPRAGFVLLLAVLAGFELLFISEARDGAAALGAERSLRERRAVDALDEELLGALDVAEARLEALETLPLVEDDGLLRVRDGVQYFPRFPGVGGAPVFTPRDEEDSLRALAVIWPADEEARVSAMERLRKGERVDLPRGEWSPVFTEVLGRRTPSPVMRLALQLSLLARAPLAAERSTFAGESAQSLVLRAWPWLQKQDAARWCVEVQRLGDELQLKTERFAAACQRGLAEQTVRVQATKEPTLVGEWLMALREGEVRGVHVDLPAQLEALHKTLLKRGMLEPGEQLTALPTPREKGLVGLELHSPRLDAAGARLSAAMWGKTALLALTALLGLGVVFLARLAEKRKEETLAVQRDFIATVSHELRTPLAGIRLLAETLERKLGADGAARDYPHRLVVAADALGFLVENILSFNRLEAGRWVPRREPFSFASLEALLADDATLAVDAAVELRCEGLDRMAAHALDAQLIRMLAQNLLRNAWKYGRRQPVQFHVHGHDEGAVAVLRFTDNGPGIPLEERDRVFEAFHRLPPAEGRAVGGSGLGLALARRIAGLHGGTLRIASSSPDGTTFELRLPRVVPACFA
ncbi:MAG: HAMP domain-containing sensor histidine kinase [Archangium sp.]|nr:HAMP domain-containing sensor histidine kinase [Archangium sp.]